MARVCIGCGLTTDANGNLIVNPGCGLTCDAVTGKLIVHTAGTANSDCSVINGTPINCKADGSLVGAPEKFIRTGFAVASFGTGELTSFAPADFTDHGLPGFAQVDIQNPSPCLPMNVHLRFGVNHGDFENNAPSPFTSNAVGGTESRVELIPAYTSIGTTADVALNKGGHQIWGGAAFESLDSQGSSSLRSHVIPAGGLAQFFIFAFIRVDVYNGNTQLANYQTFIDVFAYNP